MIVESTAADYAALLTNCAPRGYQLADSAIAPPEVIEMLANVAATVREHFTPASWLIVEDDEIVGLCSITRPPVEGVIDIGYGVAPSRQGRGAATRAIRDIVAWASTQPEVAGITAETSISNPASQRVLAANGFSRIGERLDEEDGQLICWHCPT